MAPTISLTEDAYENLDRHRREGESFSDVVRRLTSCGTLSKYYDRLDEDTAADLDRVVRSRREQ